MTVARRSAFTLLELLVVIAIIALLISILVPALSAARAHGKAAVCLSNLRQASTIFFQYSVDNDGVIPGTYWEGPVNLDWSGANNAAYLTNPTNYRIPIQTSVIWRYLEGVDKILECPSVYRESNEWYDYTVIIRFAGAKTDLPWQMTYPERPGIANSPRKRFQMLPMLIEEDGKFYNTSFPDGSFAWDDQFATRHNHGCHLGYIDGSAGHFIPPMGRDPNVAEPGDLEATDLRLIAYQREFTVYASSATEFGWVNKPR